MFFDDDDDDDDDSGGPRVSLSFVSYSNDSTVI